MILASDNLYQRNVKIVGHGGKKRYVKDEPDALKNFRLYVKGINERNVEDLMKRTALEGKQKQMPVALQSKN